MIELHGYLDESGRKPFESWFEALDPMAAAKVTVALTRIEQRNLSNAKAARRNQKDIQAARTYWADYKRRKKLETE